MADIAIFRINYKSDFILTLQSDAGWMTPFCIKFWTGAPSQAYFAGYDGTTYTHCAPVDGDPTKLSVQFDDHHLPIGDMKFQIGYHFTVADFPTSIEDEVINQAAVIIDNDGEQQQVMLDFNGETAPEIAFAMPAYANEAQRIANEQARIAAEEQRVSNEQQRISNEEGRISAEESRQENEQQRIHNEETRIAEFASLKAEAIAATGAANDAATFANEKAQLAADKAALAQTAATLANDKAQLAADKASLAQAAATLANDKAALAQQKADYAQAKAEYAQAQGDYAKAQSDIALADHERAETDHERAEADHDTATDDHTTATSDHTQAESDHTRAEADHTTAASDHTQASSDHSTATTDHTQAGQDHTRAESDHTTAAADHTRAESDHAAVEAYVDSLGAFDISAYHATGSVLAKYADLTAALGTNGANIPDELRKGGMSVKFVLSSDNKYVQFRLRANAFTLDIEQWFDCNIPDKCILLTGISENGASSNVTKVGDVYFNKTKKLLRKCIRWNTSASDSEYITIPFYDGAIYTYNNMLYVYDGTTLIPEVSALLPRVNSLDSEVSALSSELYSKDLIGFLEAGYFDLSVGIGNTVDISQRIPSASGTKSACVECQGGDLYSVSGYGGSASRLWGFIDEDNKLIAVSEPSLHTSDPIRLEAPENAKKVIYQTILGFVTDTFCLLGDVPAIKEDISILKEGDTKRIIDFSINNDSYYEDGIMLLAMKTNIPDNKIPFNLGYLFCKWNDNKSLYYGTNLNEFKEIGSPAGLNNKSLKYAISPKDGRIIMAIRNNRGSLYVWDSTNEVLTTLGFNSASQKPMGWLYNSGCCFDIDENENEICLFAEYSQSPGTSGGFNIWRGTYPYTEESMWDVVMHIPYAGDDASGITHFHQVRRDPWTGIIYATSGDASEVSKWWYSTDHGQTFNLLTTGATSGFEEHICRIINFIFTEDKVYFATDHGTNHCLNSIERNSQTGVLDVSTRLKITDLPYGQATNFLCYSEFPKGIFMYDRWDIGYSPLSPIKVQFYSLETQTLIDVAELQISDTWGGHRGGCYVDYLSTTMGTPAMGFDLNSPCIFKLSNPNIAKIGTISYDVLGKVIHTI